MRGVLSLHATDRRTRRSSDVFLEKGAKIEIDGLLDDTLSLLGVSMEEPGEFTSGWSTHMDGKDPNEFFDSNLVAYKAAMDGDEAVLAETPAKAQEMYRLYNPYADDYHYTTSEFELDLLVELGWIDEGIGWYSAGENGVPVYRQYNPYATVGTHNYTTSEEETAQLVGLGWRAEGIGWYGL